MITFKEFIKKYIGKSVDYDGYAGVQCVDLAKLYLDKCFNLKCGEMGNAKNWWYDRNSNPILKKNFNSVTVDNSRPYAKTPVQAGDIGIRTSGKYGHIFLIQEVKNNIIYYYDFNGTGNHDAMTLRKKPYSSYYVTGILRKKTEQKKISAKSGLHYYSDLKSDAEGTIPYNTTVKQIVKDVGKKKVDGTSYSMSIIWYKNKQYYVAQKYLKG